MTSGHSSLVQQLLSVLTRACRLGCMQLSTAPDTNAAVVHNAKHVIPVSLFQDRSCAQLKAGQQLPTQRCWTPAQHMRLSTPGQVSTLCSLGCRCSLLGTFHRNPANQQQNNMIQVNSSTCPLGAAATAHLNTAQRC